MPEELSVFISYAREDAVFVRRLDEALRLKGVDIRADWQLARGEKYDEELRRFIRDTDATIFVITPDSIGRVPAPESSLLRPK